MKRLLFYFVTVVLLTVFWGCQSSDQVISSAANKLTEICPWKLKNELSIEKVTYQDGKITFYAIIDESDNSLADYTDEQLKFMEGNEMMRKMTVMDCLNNTYVIGAFKDITRSMAKEVNLHFYVICKGSNSGKDNRTCKINVLSNDDKTAGEKYLTVDFTVASGKQVAIDHVDVLVSNVSKACTFDVEVSDVNGTSISTTGESFTGTSEQIYTVVVPNPSDKKFSGKVTVKITPYKGSGSATEVRLGKYIYVFGEVETIPVSGYSITKSATNGTITVTDGTDAITSADEDDVVYIAATPNTGYGFTSWSVYKTGDAETTVTLSDDDDADNKTRKFTMPAYPVTVGATFTAINYNVTHSAATGGSYTIKVGDAEATDDNTTANYGQTVVLAATPSSGYVFGAWDVYKTGESTTKVSVSNNTFTMPAYAVTVSASFTAIPTVDNLVEISDDWTFTPSATLTANTLYESGKIISLGDGNPYTSGKGIRIKENRAIAFKVAANAKVKVTFVKDGSIQMQLGTATSGEARLAYGYSTTSPKEFDIITTGGVVYLTASNQLDMSKLEIMYPHTVTYNLNGGTGDPAPTQASKYVGETFTAHDGVTGITAPATKEFNKWVDQDAADVAGGTTYTMPAKAVTLTAQWATPLPEPTITFNDGAYTIGGAALDLSTLFSSNSTGAVTYSVKTAGETGAAIDGTNFSATAAGSAVVTATQAATASYKTKSVDATITISAPSEVDGVKLIVDGDLTGNFRTSASLSSTAHTVAGIAYPKYIGLSARTSWSSQPSGPDNYLLQYTLTKKTNKFYFYAYNTNGGVQNVKVYVKEEGEDCTTTNVPVSANSGELVSCDVNVSKNAEVCISVSATSLHICQVVVVESGDDQLVAPAVNYNISFNKGRLTAKKDTEKTFEGMTYCNNADYKIDNSGNLKLTTRGTHYVSFEIPAGQTRQLQITAGGGAYNVSKELGDDLRHCLQVM